MDSFSVLIGGKAGDGIAEAGRMIARVLNRLGYRLYQHVDSPSLIRGGHTYVLVRAHRGRVSAHRDHVNVLIALDDETVGRHRWRLKTGSVLVYDSEAVSPSALPERAQSLRNGVSVGAVIREEGGIPVMRNTVILGAFCKTLSIPWSVLEEVVVRHQRKAREVNLRVARRGYDLTEERLLIHLPGAAPQPVLTGLQAVGLGLVAAGLQAYAGYPMTPSSGLLHFLAEQAPRFGLKVYQPEGEIAVMLMALGHAYAGERVAVGTSGGGFCLMAEGLSLAGQAELPIVIALGQRTGPSTGLPTYTAQSDLEFAINAGHGEFPRAVIAPGDVEQAYAWSTLALDLAWKYQLPVIVLGDRTLNDNAQSFSAEDVPRLPRLVPVVWNGEAMDARPDLAYKRYRLTGDGVSPLAFAGREGAVVKVNSYTHDEWGATTEDPATTVEMQEKLLRKGRAMARELDELPLVNVFGDAGASSAIVTWGSPTGALREIGELAGVRVVQPVVLWPFPTRQLRQALAGATQVGVAEVNATGQLASLMERHGLRVDVRVNRFDGRPWGVGELRRQVEEALT
jgi:2-oxoglutarate/2-oxoacid ferredoxin oxidoreductase subunit alpha